MTKIVAKKGDLIITGLGKIDQLVDVNGSFKLEPKFFACVGETEKGMEIELKLDRVHDDAHDPGLDEYIWHLSIDGYPLISHGVSAGCIAEHERRMCWPGLKVKDQERYEVIGDRLCFDRIPADSYGRFNIDVITAIKNVTGLRNLPDSNRAYAYAPIVFNGPQTLILYTPLPRFSTEQPAHMVF